jgi:hypothetical protein
LKLCIPIVVKEEVSIEQEEETVPLMIRPVLSAGLGAVPQKALLFLGRKKAGGIGMAVEV